MQGGDGLLEALRQGVLGNHADGGLVRGYADGGSILDAIRVGLGVAASQTANPITSIASAVTANPLDAIKNIVSSILSSIGSSPFAQIAAGALTKVGDGLAQKVLGLLSGAGTGGAAGGGGTPYTGPVAAGVEQWRNVALQMLSKEGQDIFLIDTLLRRMNQESGGNPNAINLTDINARNGTPSKGLMQVIDPTFASYHDPRLSGNIYDPSANIASSIRYAMSRYGSLANAYNRPGGYAEGGVVKPLLLDSGNVLKPLLADNGTILAPGLNLVQNNTGGPERLSRTDRMATVHQTFNIPQSDPYLIAAESARRMLMGV